LPQQQVGRRGGKKVSGECRMEVDTSDYAMGGVLSMKCKDGKW